MKTILTFLIITCLAIGYSCSNTGNTSPEKARQKVYAKEPADSADYLFLTANFYLRKGGLICERKLALSSDTSCCQFQVLYDSMVTIYTDDAVIKKPLADIIHMGSFVEIDSTQFSKDKDHVYYFHPGSDGGHRVIINKADPASFKRLCEYRWGIDNNNVFYRADIVEGVNIKHLQVLYPPDTADHFVWYIKDDKKVFYENTIITGADAKTFKVVSGQKWDAEDKNYKYEAGRQQ